MSKTRYRDDEPVKPVNPNVLPEDSADGDRTFTVDEAGTASAEQASTGDTQDGSMIEAFDEEGAGIAAKE